MANWIGILLGIAGILAGIVMWLKPARPKPVYQRYDLPLLEADNPLIPEGITILFGDRPVSRLTKTYISFWNAGLDVLNGSAVVEGDPIRWSYPKDTEVLRVRVLRFTRDVNDFDAAKDPDFPNAVRCTFDFLDRRDGAVFEILHTSVSKSPSVSGSIKGVPQGVQLRRATGRPSTAEERAFKSKLAQFNVPTKRGTIYPLRFLANLDLIGVILLFVALLGSLTWMLSFTMDTSEYCTPLPPGYSSFEQCKQSTSSVRLFLFLAIGGATFFFVRGLWSIMRRAPTPLNLYDIVEPLPETNRRKRSRR